MRTVAHLLRFIASGFAASALVLIWFVLAEQSEPPRHAQLTLQAPQLPNAQAQPAFVCAPGPSLAAPAVSAATLASPAATPSGIVPIPRNPFGALPVRGKYIPRPITGI